MKRFRFRLSRVERWRGQVERERRHEHAASLVAIRRAEQAVAAHDAEIDRFVAESAAARRSGRLTAEAWSANDGVLVALSARRSELDAELLAAMRIAEKTLDALVQARRDVEVVEALHRSRRERWWREAEREMQKLADEMHQARLARRSEGEGSGPAEPRNRNEGGAR